MLSRFIILLAGVSLLLELRVNGQESSTTKSFSDAAKEKIVPNQPSVRGDDDSWLFLVKELRQIALGEFWTRPWEEVASNKTDPIPSMVEFHQLLADKGIDLLVVPVPAKAAIYPEKLSEGYSVEDTLPLEPLIGNLRTQGLNVVDLEPVMKKWKVEFGDKKIYCQQDAHFTPFACEKLAELLSAELINLGLENSGEFGVSGESVLEIEGDQVKDSKWSGVFGTEELKIRYAGKKTGNATITPVEPSESSPVLLLGDSHTLVFQEGDDVGMHCKGGGLFDHISAAIGQPLDLVGVRGSGLMQARKQAFYKAAALPGYWSKKELVIWVFSVREFTQSADKIISVPLER